LSAIDAGSNSLLTSSPTATRNTQLRLSLVLSTHTEPGICGQVSAGHESCLVAGKEHQSRGYLLRPAKPSLGYQGVQSGLSPILFSDLRRPKFGALPHWRGNRARGNGIYSNVVGRTLKRGHTGEESDSRFAGPIGRVACQRFYPCS